MKKHFFLLFYLLSSLVCRGEADPQLDSLLYVLDQSIQERSMYTAEKQERIRALEMQVYHASSTEERFDVLGSLFEEYKNFQMDSTLVIAGRRLQIAIERKDERRKNISYLNKAEAMIVTGMYKEALDIIDALDRAAFTNEETAYIHHLYHSLYMLMAAYSVTREEKENYLFLERNYKDSILQTINNPEDVGYKLVSCAKLRLEGQKEKALEQGLKVLEEYTNDPRIVAMMAHTIAETYAALGDRRNQKKYLAISAIGDMRSGVKEYMSLSELAELLYQEKEIDRSYLYIKSSLEDAIFCKARLRALEMSRILPIINSAYDIKMKGEKEQLVQSLFVITFLLCILAIALVYIYKQLKILAKVRQSLKEFNEALTRKNEELNKLNDELSESNHVKEEYISYVFTMCSSYIDKMEDFRKRVYRKIKANQTDELYKEIHSGTLVNDELKEFYKSFDTIFLNIYPDFVDDFNSLLQEGSQIVPKEGEMLTPELRIYALIRLGICDSVKIASFLHYSPQTVYNYRLKVRNKSKTGKENFLEAVKQLGKIDK
ncbi:hypothetical protein D0T51_09060 [Parabacteroides sp. 52]|uniref:DUF6377 domain-containing protein n=1 Tax=unclassified Parabacteroides TaxID=2649774 RepID=UPI0013D51B44|nr:MULTISPECIES: DUF6377 domain-containing protein [unclassified Parabacteroides]MDH6535336.1 hypothetical protein [Parabacteroides sp. PM5-20]NDV55872.1 hypothetical protein [Parabacteroides sp. 52]